MNAVFLYLAFSTFGGIEDAGAYRANFLIGKEAAAASKQDRLGWKVTGAFQRRKGGRASLMISATGRSGEPVAIRSVDVELRRPGKRQLDRKLPLTRTAPGRYAGDFAGIAPGQWLVSIRLRGTGGELFESRNRVILK